MHTSIFKNPVSNYLRAIQYLIEPMYVWGDKPGF